MTVGFSGKRFFDDDPFLNRNAEERARRALREAILWFFRRAAPDSKAGLRAVSSAARGGDLLFAETCQTFKLIPNGLPWKCLLPFDADSFFRWDLATDAKGRPLPVKEKESRRRQALLCLEGATEVVEPTAQIHADNEGARANAYMECGYQTVHESDMMIFLLKADEFASLLENSGMTPLARNGGTLDLAGYTLAAGHPALVMNADATDPWKESLHFNIPEPKT